MYQRLTNPYWRDPQVASQPAYLRSAAYKVWNGKYPLPGQPNIQRSFSRITFLINSVPADLSTLILSPPVGAPITFQFVKVGSVQNLGLPISIPAGAGSVAATQAAMVAAFNSGSGIPLGGAGRVWLPFKAVPLNADSVTLQYHLPGPANGVAGTQATIQVTNTNFPLSDGVACIGSAGPMRVVMPD